MNHEIDLSKTNIRTDLAIEEIKNKDIKNIYKEEKDDINITTIVIDETNNKDFKKKDGKYITIEFKDATDYNNSKKVERIP